MIDGYKHQGLRKQLVALLKEKGIENEAVLSAIGKIPRHFFLDSAFENYAYQDMAFQIGAGQTISQPYTVAFQSELLKVEKNHKVLEIGTGSGYQTAVLLELGAKVFSIERQKQLFDKTKDFLPKLGYKTAKLFYGDGFIGKETFAPYDRIIITCGAPFVPPLLLEQLKPNGRMVIPVDDGNVQKMMLIEKNALGEVLTNEFGNFKFVPMLQDKA